MLGLQFLHGALRLGLATLVVLSHLGHPGPVNVGVSAVVVFYLLSGYVVTRLLQKHFPPGRLFAFYAERFLRIYPLYLVFLLAVSVFLCVTGFGPPQLTPVKAFANLTIIPTNYFMFVDVWVVRRFCILPTVWSLGAEMQVYAVLPLIIRSLRAKWIVGLFSLCVFSAAAVGLLDSDVWGYRLLPGILFIFLTGSAIAKSMKARDNCDAFDRIFPTACWIWLLLLLLGLGVINRLPAFSTAVMLGFLIGMPMFLFASASPLRIPYDTVLGGLSYGLFLIHLPVAWLFEYCFWPPRGSKCAVLFVMVVSLALSAGANITIERMVWPVRKALTEA